MKKQITIFATLLVMISCQNTKEAKPIEKEAILKPHASYYPKEKTKILIVGVFHFNYPGMDYTKTENSDKIDVLKEPKKSEVSELVAYIKQFKPTKIAIEAKPDWKLGKKYKEYRKGMHRNNRNESYQLGMRIANDYNLDTIYSVDAKTLSDDLFTSNPEFMKKMTKDYDFESDDPFEAMVKKSFDESAKMPSKVNLLEYFKYSNSIEGHRNNYGAYFIGDFKLEDNRGADFLSVWWYNRNLRIFRNIQKINQTKEDRILVIIGNGHASVLRHMIESSPEYDFIEFNELKTETEKS